jgi:hypothetical protein
VLGTPPAFVLSQDQTLQFISCMKLALHCSYLFCGALWLLLKELSGFFDPKDSRPSDRFRFVLYTVFKVRHPPLSRVSLLPSLEGTNTIIATHPELDNGLILAYFRLFCPFSGSISFFFIFLVAALCISCFL